MNLDRDLKNRKYAEIWQEYCGFLDLSMAEYMETQYRLMREQIALYSGCRLGKRIMGDEPPKTIAELRKKVPLTTYEDYADILLQKRVEDLPAEPAIWIETTWEGGKNPKKVAPYTHSMVENHRGTIISVLLFATSDRKGHFSLRPHQNCLFGMAPLPYFTGLIPYVLDGQLSVNFMPDASAATRLSFSARNKEGFKLGLLRGVDIFVGMSSVLSRMSELFAEGGSGGKNNLLGATPKMVYRLIRAKALSREQGNSPILPKNVWKPKGLICGGTDSPAFKKKIENYWGIRPLEMFGGTEPTCVATETWAKDGMIFFPEVCFYEFIPEAEMEHSIEDPSYSPRTFLMDEVKAGEKYELVISNFKGGAFMRYRVGDVFRCLSTKNEVDGIDFPQFAYVDRIPTVIDIAGFTRVTENTVKATIATSGLDIVKWFAVKEFSDDNRPYMHFFAELGEKAITSGAVASDIIREHLSVYFRYIDVDYQDLKKMLGIDPLMVTILPSGSIEAFENGSGHNVRHMNPSHYDVTEIEHIAGLR